MYYTLRYLPSTERNEDRQFSFFSLFFFSFYHNLIYKIYNEAVYIQLSIRTYTVGSGREGSDEKMFIFHYYIILGFACSV